MLPLLFSIIIRCSTRWQLTEVLLMCSPFSVAYAGIQTYRRPDLPAGPRGTTTRSADQDTPLLLAGLNVLTLISCLHSSEAPSIPFWNLSPT